jgi:hypothetical protein
MHGEPWPRALARWCWAAARLTARRRRPSSRVCVCVCLWLASRDDKRHCNNVRAVLCGDYVIENVRAISDDADPLLCGIMTCLMPCPYLSMTRCIRKFVRELCRRCGWLAEMMSVHMLKLALQTENLDVSLRRERLTERTAPPSPCRPPRERRAAPSGIVPADSVACTGSKGAR